jgi:RNA polymerase sigma-70 factor (ECF subfamily)
LVSASDENDADLVAEVREGSRAAANILAERYLRSCRAIALAVLGDIAAAEDTCQEAFVYAIEHIDDCRDPERFGAWLRQIVRSTAKNQLRYRRIRRTESLPEGMQDSGLESPAEGAERRDLAAGLLVALSTLAPDRREVVLLHDLEGWTHSQIAEQMGIPAGTVRSHLHFARRQLRLLLTKYRIDDE